jgi:hypothetical protein
VVPLASGPAEGKGKGKVILQRRAAVIGIEPYLGAQVQITVLVERKAGNESGRVGRTPRVKWIRDKLGALLITPNRRGDRKGLRGRGRSFQKDLLEHSRGRRDRRGLEERAREGNRRSKQRRSGAGSHADNSVERGAQQTQRRSGILGGMPQSGGSGRDR